LAIPERHRVTEQTARTDVAASATLDAPLFDDNPAAVDLLGHEPIAKAISVTVTDPRLNPITVGVNSPWGGGKSTVLGLVQIALSQHPRVMVVEIDPWEFVDSGDPRGTLIMRVLDELARRVMDDAALTKDATKKDAAVAAARELGRRLDSMRKRIVWSKVAATVVKSAVTLSPDIPGLVDALTPAPATPSDETDQKIGMSGFRKDFAKLLSEIPDVDRVVVLVDDLDRCLPPDILGSLEAIKLFLSVSGMAFVLAADEDLLRAALAGEIGMPGGQDFASRYTEKIVQLPFSLPRLSKADAEAYIVLLLCGADERCSEDDLRALGSRAAERRSRANAPYVIADGVCGWPTMDQARQAQAIANGLAAPEWSSPRAIKRFLNNFAVRAQIARAWGSPIDLDVLMKMWIFEHRDSKLFNELAKLGEPDRPGYLARLESENEASSLPPGVHEWAIQGPLLSQHGDAVTAYLTLAAAVITNVTIGGALSQDEADILRRLIDPSQPIRRAGQQAFRDSTAIRRDAVLVQLADAVTNPGRREYALESLQLLAPDDEETRTQVLNVLLRNSVIASLQTEDLTSLNDYPEVLQRLAETSTVASAIRQAARDELQPSTVP
jgi:hypothetical protein